MTDHYNSEVLPLLMATCPYCDDELTGRCDCGSPACVCGYCPKCESSVDLDDEDDTDLDGIDVGDESE